MTTAETIRTIGAESCEMGGSLKAVALCIGAGDLGAAQTLLADALDHATVILAHVAGSFAARLAAEIEAEALRGKNGDLRGENATLKEAVRELVQIRETLTQLRVIDQERIAELTAEALAPAVARARKQTEIANGELPIGNCQRPDVRHGR